MILSYKKKSETAAVVVLVAFLGAMVCNALNDPLHLALQVVVALFASIAGIAFWYSAWFYIKAKGRSGWWLLMLIFNLVGLLVLALLRDRATGDLSEVVDAPVESHRTWAGIAMLDNLNGWQRLWMLLTILWFVTVGYLAYSEWPSPHSFSADTRCITGCSLPDGWRSVAAPRIVNDELTGWRRELPPNLDLTEEQVTLGKEYAPKTYTLCEALEAPPIWARPPRVNAYCETLIERLERSGRGKQLREASANAMQEARIEWLALVLAAFIGPAVGIYLLGLAIVWVVRGFRQQP